MKTKLAKIIALACAIITSTATAAEPSASPTQMPDRAIVYLTNYDYSKNPPVRNKNIYAYFVNDFATQKYGSITASMKCRAYKYIRRYTLSGSYLEMIEYVKGATSYTSTYQVVLPQNWKRVTVFTHPTFSSGENWLMTYAAITSKAGSFDIHRPYNVGVLENSWTYSMSDYGDFNPITGMLVNLDADTDGY